MVRKRLRILSEFKTPLPLKQALGIKILLPYHNGATLEKNAVDVIDDEAGIIEFGLSDFELQGLPEGLGQSFKAEIQTMTHKLVVLFAKGMNITVENERKVWR